MVPNDDIQRRDDMADQETADILRRIAKEPIAEFRGVPWYNPHGDCFIWYFSNRESYAERIDDKLTVYRSLEDDEIVGCQVKGVSALLIKLGNFDVKFQDRGLALELIFCVSHFAATELDRDPVTRQSVYNRLRTQAAGLRVSIPQDDQLCEA